MKLVAILIPGLLVLLSATSILRAETLGALLANQIRTDYHLDSQQTQIEYLSTRYVNEPVLGRTLTYKALTPRPPKGLFTVLLTITDSTGGVISGQARMRVHTFDSAFVATRAIDRGQVLTAESVTFTRVETTNLCEQAISDTTQLFGKRTTRTIPNGGVVTSGSVDEPYLVHAGRTVAIRYVTPQFTIESQGLAVQNGRRGDLVRVRNTETGAQLQARVAEENRVTITD